MILGLTEIKVGLSKSEVRVMVDFKVEKFEGGSNLQSWGSFSTLTLKIFFYFDLDFISRHRRRSHFPE